MRATTFTCERPLLSNGNLGLRNSTIGKKRRGVKFVLESPKLSTFLRCDRAELRQVLDTAGKCLLLDRSAAKSPRAARGPLCKGGFWVPSFHKGGTGRILPAGSSSGGNQCARLKLQLC